MLAEPHFRKVAFLGIGLIGSSLARVIREKGLADEIVAYSRSDGTRDRAVELGVVDRAEADPGDAVEGADLVVFALHLGGYEPVAEAIAGRLAPGAIVTDVGSAKAAAAEALKAHLPDTVHLVPGHPVAGTEFSGPEAGFAELFDGRFCILTPEADADQAAVETVRALWRAAGMQVELMDARHHDIVLALTSHLPHVIAYTIVGTATELEEDLKSEVIKFSAGGFRDFTRIAASDPEFWRDVLLTNREAVLEMLTRFTEDLTAMRKALRRNDGAALLDWFTRTREVRRGIIDARQHEWEDLEEARRLIGPLRAMPSDDPRRGSQPATPGPAGPDTPETSRAALALAAIPPVFVCLWSTGFIFTKLGMPSTEPATFLTMRFAIVLALLLALALITRAPWPRAWRPAAHSVVVGVLLHGVYLGGVFAAIAAGVPAGIAALVVGVQPVLTATLVGPVLGERVSPMQWVGLVLGLCGITLVLWQKLSFGEGTPAGYLYAAGALVGITLATLYQKRYASNADLITGGVFQYGGALLVVALAATIFESFRVEPSWDLAIALVWLSVVLSVVSIWLLMVMIRRGAAGRVASLFYLVPPLTALIAWPAFGETLGALALAGMALAAVGVALVNR